MARGIKRDRENSMNYEEIIEQLDDNKVKALLDKLQIPFEEKGRYQKGVCLRQRKQGDVYGIF